MNILFDLKGTQPKKISKILGGGRYGEMVLRRIADRGLPIHCCYDSRLWLNPEMMKLISDKQIPLYDLYENSLEEIIKKIDVALIYLPLLSETIEHLEHIDTDKCNILATIHDMRSLEVSIDFYQLLYKSSLGRMVRNALKWVLSWYVRKKHLYQYGKLLSDKHIGIITVSNHTAYAFKAFFPQQNKNRSFPVFYAPSTSWLETNTRKYQEKYFLLVSCNRYSKNCLRAIKALDRLFTNGYAEGFKVKLTGIDNLNVFWSKIKNKDRFECVGFVDEKELDQLFHDAYCFIYPTLQEGFGYPPLEAMHYGVPVLSSPFTAIPEICGGNVMYFNPLSIEEIMNRILMILDDEVHTKYSQLGRERYELITKKQNEDLDRLIDYIYKYQE